MIQVGSKPFATSSRTTARAGNWTLHCKAVLDRAGFLVRSGRRGQQAPGGSLQGPRSLRRYLVIAYSTLSSSGQTTDPGP
ncbi:hypothetical protein HBH56_241460 [Parastagonospora nodorum]|nr:hypothetical protein HBH56_241460 [Parastagonospora nodorum]KAH3968371.1 hypothetical protein HBH52_181710 [Parastagonospora nodorum]KAH4008936.1 hypothetical protein HBI13_228380 [Parastagonospora nodorum]KAH4042748.1 hypothetical protein HBH49_244660 [Parastagonospora nodorum]KAH4056699.1 hypothetical protein HBH50_241450 [Parastagonospora nodorum]